MSDVPVSGAASEPSAGPALEQGTYEVLRARLAAQGAELRQRLETLNTARQEVFGAIPTALLSTERLTTKNNCTPRDIIPIGGGRFLLGYNVQVGLRSELKLEDVFAIYDTQDRTFRELPLDAISDPQFQADFKSLYKYYKDTTFTKFSIIEPHLFMEFRIGKSVTDIKTFKWLLSEGALSYLGNRFDHEYVYPPQHEFTWIRTHRELHRSGLHPHISIEDRVFVECVGGDLTIKVEDNTNTGEGIYREPVDYADQTLDDAEIHYAIVGSLILLKVRPYQEKTVRHLVFNEKVKEVRRIDAIADACVLLPDDHGILFVNGYYLQSGEFKLFETEAKEMVFYRRIASPNGEDTLFAFYQRDTGEYALLSYNLIARALETPILCHGFSLFENGEMAIFRSDAQPQKHHVIQIWQTPYVGPSWEPAVQPTSYLYKIGNPTLVSAMAECQQILTLVAKEDSYTGLYLDLVRETGAILDSYFWLSHAEAGGLREPLVAIKDAAAAALSEFDKVAGIKRSTAAAATETVGKARALISAIGLELFEKITAFVARLADLRGVRGELISLKERRYIDLPLVEEVEREVTAATESLAQKTVEFLLQPEALVPFRERVDGLLAAVPVLTKVADAQKLEEEVSAASRELDLLVETVSNLKIQDATETTRIIEGVSTIYAVANQARAGLRQKVRELRGSEAVAEFASQTRLLDQALANYLDLCTTPEKCDEYLNRMLVQVEELEARFADFEEYVIELSEKRTALSGAFEARKIELVETRNRKAGGLFSAAERILKGIQHRAERFATLDEINAYFAADAMVEKVRDQIAQLIALGDSVKADDLQSRLKTVREDAARQLKDRQELFAGGANVIQLGRHQFLVNTQALDLTVVPRGEEMCLHVTGTNYFEPITDGAFLSTKPVWGLELVSETAAIYRAEYLAFKMLGHVRTEEAVRWSEEERLNKVREFAAGRYAEGYVKGVHDHDAAKILGALVELQTSLGLLRYPSAARACAALFWNQFPEGERKTLLTAKLRGFATMRQLFPRGEMQAAYVREVHTALHEWAQRTALFPESCLAGAAEYLYFQIKQGGDFVVSSEAARIARGFQEHLAEKTFTSAFATARRSVEADLPSHFELLRDWVGGYLAHHDRAAEELEFIDEAAWLLFRDAPLLHVNDQSTGVREIEGLAGTHPTIAGGRLRLAYVPFMERLQAHETLVVPLYERLQQAKRELISEARTRLGLDDFRPKVLTSFVRNRLIDAAYLPLVGDNLAKQIGAAGDAKRTDRMGLLLLVSPPGYGKTTLMEYVASRLGIVFVKVNGPAIGHRVTSLDPAEAPNAAARSELTKLNLAFEMGDNVMVCLDDIQHLNPEFLQKFISLCDGSRRIEGVYRGEPRTYDLRGRKVVVVMAGNPYTESGDKFQIPDMLANRADTYNLGDIVGAHAEVFKSSYLENAATSNPTLARVAGRSHRDLLALIRLAEGGTREGVEFEHDYSAGELNELLGVTQKMLRLRDVVLRVNEEYIRSAAQAEAYRTEPPFKLQGSYRNMGRLAEKVVPVMNDSELEELLQTHYRNESQTLTSEAESNLLRLREITGALTPAEIERLENIRKSFRQNQLLRGGDERDPVSQVVRQLAACFAGIDSIKEVLAASLQDRPSTPPAAQPITLIIAPTVSPATTSNGFVDGREPKVSSISDVQIDQETLAEIWKVIESRRKAANTRPVVDSNGA